MLATFTAASLLLVAGLVHAHEPAAKKPGQEAGHQAGHAGHEAMVTTPVASRSIDIRMDDAMRFYPDRIRVKKGEVVRFNILNTGALPHELTIGELDELLAHAEEMRANPDMPAHHEANAITVEPGQRGSLTFAFDKAGTLDFACLIPGHFEAGMKGEFIIG